MQIALNDVGIGLAGPAEISQAIKRSDVGQLLLGTQRSTFEARGTPSKQATPAFRLVAETGFNLGRDKGYNRSMAEAITAFMEAEKLGSNATVPEQGLLGSKLIPDNAIDFDDEILCIEYTWRKGDFLSTGHRSDVAQYILEKLKNYAVALGWTEA
jgi:hypothetical protein